jgi:hypothetical protein
VANRGGKNAYWVMVGKHERERERERDRLEY